MRAWLLIAGLALATRGLAAEPHAVDSPHAVAVASKTDVSVGEPFWVDVKLEGSSMYDAALRSASFSVERRGPYCPAEGEILARSQVPHRGFKIFDGEEIRHLKW